MNSASIDQQVEAEEQLRSRLHEYAGKWVAVRDHEIVTDAESAGALLEKVGAEDIDGIFEVPAKGAVCFF
jgi:hypothetical protein